MKAAAKCGHPLEPNFRAFQLAIHANFTVNQALMFFGLRKRKRK